MESEVCLGSGWGGGGGGGGEGKNIGVMLASRIEHCQKTIKK